MAVELFALGKTIGGSALKFAGSWVKGALAKRRARNRATRGEDLSSEGSLEHIVKSELGKLATSSALPQELQNDAFRAWLLTDDCVERFCEVLIAQAGGDPALAQRARDELASRYEQATGETRKLATGPLNLAVSDVYGQLRATQSSKQALENALALRSAAQLHALRHPELRPFPTDADLGRLQTVSARLLEAGRATWKMPAFVAPLTLEAHEEKDEKDVHPIAAGQLGEAIEAGDSIVLFGDGGIGKTTFLLELASLFTRESRRRIPLYVDAAIWARSGASVLDYLAGTPPAQAHGVTSGELAKLAEGGFLVLMVNGWNEIPAERKAYCRETFNLLTTAAPALAVVVASRTAHDAASLRSPRRVAVRGLTWHGQSAVVRSELGDEAAHSLLEVLAKDTRLRHAARSPLILRGLIAQAQTGAKDSANVYDLLGAVVATFEGDDQRRLILAEAPVFGMQEHYVEELACSLNARGATNLTREDALVAVTAAANRMVKEGLLGAVPQPMAVLDVLASHHVLHVQDTFVRFAHQRFQEYFAAARLLRIGGTADNLMTLLCEAVNQPAWADSFELVAGKLKASGGSAAARARLVQAAEAVDLAYACDLAGLCAFAEADDATLHLRLVQRVNEIGASPLKEVQELAIACQIASRFPAFADKLWTLFESDEQQVRLHSHRLNGSRVSLVQLGPQAEARIKAWPPALRAEFLHEIADNPDNYDFIASAAVADPDPEVRAAAMSALFWSFPASTAVIKAWLDAPLEVQTKHDLVNYIDYALEQDILSDQVRKQLRVIAASVISDDARLQLALAFPAEVGPYATDVVLARLRNEERQGNPGALISIATAHAPDRLRALSLELVAEPRGTPQWVGELLLGETSEVREAAFERAWEALQAGGVRCLSPETVGPLSSTRQTERSIAAWLRYCVERRNKLSDAEHERGREIGYLLAHAPGDDLLGVVMELGTDASYEESVELAEMLLTRVSRGEGHVSDANPWSPKPEQFTRLFDLLSSKPEEARNPQDRLFTLLACIASHVASAEFGSLLLEALRRHLDAWTAYRALLDEWLKKPSSSRPNNPSLGNYVISALTRWGMDALPGVLQMLSHQDASDLVPEAIGRIASLPWASTKKQVFSSVNTDIQDGHQRRDAGCVLQQPSAAHQPTTDDAARALAGLLNVEVDRQLTERETNPKWNAKQAEYRVGHLVGILANLPSAEIVTPVTRTLSSGLLEMYGFVGALRGLTRQGWVFSDARVVSEFEALYERETSPARFHESTRYTLAEFSQLMFLVEPSTLLKLPLSHYLSQWQRFSHPSEVIRVLGDMKTEQVFPSLLALATELSAKGQSSEAFAYALVSALSSKHFAEFAHLVAEGTLFSWCRNGWTVERIAPAVAEVVKDAPEHLSLLIDSCRKNASPLADALLGEVLSSVGGVGEMRLEIGLEAVDAGRANHMEMPAYRMLMGMFTLKVPMGENQFEVYPRACNPLRQQLYRRAKSGGDTATAARSILASLECARREDGRPVDEPRHPEPSDGLPWTNALCPSGAPLSQRGGAF